jgi:plasmid maintenance system antidote protein VapI
MTSAEIASILEKSCPESVAEVRRLFKEGNSIKALAEYMDWSQWTISELVGERLT